MNRKFQIVLVVGFLAAIGIMGLVGYPLNSRNSIYVEEFNVV